MIKDPISFIGSLLRYNVLDMQCSEIHYRFRFYKGSVWTIRVCVSTILLKSCKITVFHFGSILPNLKGH